MTHKYYNLRKENKNERRYKFWRCNERVRKDSRRARKGNLSLDESVSKFEDGMKLSKKCSDLLDTAEKKITMLINDNGTIKEENFNVANIEE